MLARGSSATRRGHAELAPRLTAADHRTARVRACLHFGVRVAPAGQGGTRHFASHACRIAGGRLSLGVTKVYPNRAPLLVPDSDSGTPPWTRLKVLESRDLSLLPHSVPRHYGNHCRNHCGNHLRRDVAVLVVVVSDGVVGVVEHGILTLRSGSAHRLTDGLPRRDDLLA